MSGPCPITGEAVVRREHGDLVWEKSDPEIHIASELLQDEQAAAIIEQKYEVGERCVFAASTWHARLRGSEPRAVIDAARSRPGKLGAHPLRKRGWDLALSIRRRWDFQILPHSWPLQLGFHIDHTDPSITFHLPLLIVAIGRLKQPGFRGAP